MKERYLHFDILKGIAILFVVLGHIYNFSGVVSYTNSVIVNIIEDVHMPIFIFISGFFSVKALDLSNKGIFKYWKDKSIRFLLPLLVCPILMNWLMYGFSIQLPLAQYLGRYWFTYVLFILFVIFYGFQLMFKVVEPILKRLNCLRGGQLAYYLLSIIILFLGMHLMSYLGVSIPLSYKIGWLYKYFIMGYLVGSFVELKKLLENELIVGISFLIFIFLLAVDYMWFDLERPFAKGIIQSVTGIICFYTISLSLAKRDNQISKSLAYLGRISLPIYLTHYFFLPFFPWMNNFLENTISDKTMLITWEFWIGILGMVMTIVPTILIICIIKSNKYLDFLIYGEKLK